MLCGYKCRPYCCCVGSIKYSHIKDILLYIVMLRCVMFDLLFCCELFLSEVYCCLHVALL